MILCATLNPCLDKTLTVPPWQPGESVRGVATREMVGGKGNNVARALARLGRQARPVTFLGGPTGDRCEKLLREADGFDPLVTPTASETRVILTVRTDSTNDQSAFFDPDPAINEAEALAFAHRVEGALSAGGVEALTLSGSSPAPATHALFSDLIALAQARGVPVFLDTYGPALAEIWGFWPHAIQLNRREAAHHLGQPDASESDRLALLDRWSGRGVRIAIITDGPDPALARFRNQTFRVTPPSIDPVNPIGSGDSLLAGLVDAHLAGLDPEATLRRAVASAVSNALHWDAGDVDRSQLALLEEEIRINPLNE